MNDASNRCVRMVQPQRVPDFVREQPPLAERAIQLIDVSRLAIRGIWTLKRTRPHPQLLLIPRVHMIRDQLLRILIPISQDDVHLYWLSLHEPRATRER